MEAYLLNDFKKEIAQIRNYLTYINSINNIYSHNIVEIDNKDIEILLTNLKSQYKEFGISKKIFEYKATIISLYGLLEKYVEIWIKEYLESLSSLIVDYNNLDEKIQMNHIELSIKLINGMISRDNAKFESLDIKHIISNLNKCLYGEQEYKLNKDAFILYSGNLKHNKIVELFAPLNISLNEGLSNNNQLSQSIQELLQKPNISEYNTNIRYSLINELVSKRNEVAHGVDILNILDIEELNKYIDFVEVYCSAIFDILLQNYIKQECKYKFQLIEIVHNVINSSILLCDVENVLIKVGDFLNIETPNGQFYRNQILDLQKNRQSFTNFNICEKESIGIQLKLNIRQNYKFYVKKNM